MNLPNRLTLLRIVLSFVLIGFMLLPGLGFKTAAVVVFALAALTDLFDGKLAREKGLITDFGILMDPIADKVLVLGSFMALIQLDIVSAWIVVLIATREFLLTSIRLLALKRGQVLAAEKSGKHKTVMQMVTIALALIYLALRETAWSVEMLRSVLDFFVWLTMILTMTSGISFFWNNRKVILSF
jgi:CDP-diacylglycerol--glycerol-3-phosphate 3-phosphatidyltransferase